MPNHRLPALRLLLAAALLAFGGASIRAADLKWKFKEGDKIQYALVQDNVNNINAGGVEFEIEMKQTMDLTWNVKSVAADGTAEIGQTVDRIKLKMNTPFTGEFEYDSKGETQPEGQIWQMLGPFMEAMLGQEFTMKVSAQGEVSDVALPESLVKAMEAQGEGGGGGGRQMLMGGGFGEDSIKELISRSVVALPKGASSEPWKQESRVAMGPLGTQVTELEFTLAGAEDFPMPEYPSVAKLGKKLEKISVKSNLTMEAGEAEGGDDLGIEIELTEQEGDGSVYFDADAGRAVFSSFKQKLVMEGEFMGNELVREMSTETTVVAGTSDDLPAEPEPAEEAAPAEGDKPADSEGK